MRITIILVAIMTIFIAHATFAEQNHNIVLQNGVCMVDDSPTIRYKSGWDIPTNKRSRYKTRSGREKIQHKPGMTNIYATLLDGYTTPYIMTAEKGDTINIHLTSLIREKAPQEFLLEKFGVNELLSPGETNNITLKANTTGVFKFYSKKHCTDIPTMQEGYLLISGNGVSIESLKQNIQYFSQSDYKKQISKNREQENQDLINSLISKVTKHQKNYKSDPLAKDMVTTLTDFLGFADDYKRKYKKYAASGDWDNATIYAQRYQRYKLMAQEKGELAKDLLDDGRTKLIASKTGLKSNLSSNYLVKTGIIKKSSPKPYKSHTSSRSSNSNSNTGTNC